jgi:hypothetical protein
VIVQAGQSEAGRQLAAETAEIVFCSPPRDLVAAKWLYADIKGRMGGFPYLPQGLDDVTLKLVPELQRRDFLPRRL